MRRRGGGGGEEEEEEEGIPMTLPLLSERRD
jgi:hypothetical protein